jgi:hypothetical protein
MFKKPINSVRPFRLAVLLICFVLLWLGRTAPALAQLVTYMPPAGYLSNDDFSVRVRQKGGNWQPLGIYLATIVGKEGALGKKISEKTSFTYFDFGGSVEVAVTFQKGRVQSAQVRPALPRPISVKGNTVTFSLDEPRNLSVEVNGDSWHNLHLFANPLEERTYSPSDTSVIYYGPGIHEAGLVKVPSNKTVYVAGGAIVKGSFKMDHVQNVLITGRGILENAPGPFDIAFSKNITVDGLIMANPRHNTVGIGESDQVTIRNIKSFSDLGWGDGIDIFCSSNVLIDRVFMRNSDDCVAIYGHRGKFYGNVKNITVQNSCLWPDVAHPILIGTHGDPPHPDTLAEMKFVNLDILEQREGQIDYQGCLSLNAGDANFIRNIRFENIRIGNINKGQLFNLRIMYNSKYNTAPGRGIENIYFKDISYQGERAGMSVIAGYDEKRTIKNIMFENLMINGRVISDQMPGKPGFYKTGDMANIFIGEHVDGIRFIPGKK